MEVKFYELLPGQRLVPAFERESSSVAEQVAFNHKVEGSIPSSPTKICYKLLRLRKNGTLGPLFIERSRVLPVGKWMKSNDVPTRGYAHRPGWHSTPEMHAPHLSLNGRVWAKCEIADFYQLPRSERFGGIWYISDWMKILEVIE